MAVDLKPCPFCGGSGVVSRREDEDGIEWYRVRCTSCKAEAEGKWVSAGNDCPQFYAEVRELWNRRAVPVEGGA